MNKPQVTVYFLSLPVAENSKNQLLTLVGRVHKEVIPLQGFQYQEREDRLLSCAAEMVVRWKLSKVCKNAFNQPFTFSEKGKPYLSGAPYFNISHTENEIMVGISEIEIGVDIERIQAATFEEESDWADFFSEEELNRIPFSYPENYFALWTLKESYVKCNDWGISEKLHEIYWTAQKVSKKHVSGEVGKDNFITAKKKIPSGVLVLQNRAFS